MTLADLVEQAARADERVAFVPQDWSTSIEALGSHATSSTWSVQRAKDYPGDFVIALRDSADIHAPMIPGLNQRHWIVDTITAALWRLCIDLPDTAQRCPACNGSTHAVDAGPFVDPAFVAEARRRALRLVEVWPGYGNARVLLGGCKACRQQGEDRRLSRPSTGRVFRSWGDVMLDPGDDDRAEMVVLADQHQADGDPLGEWLALWLGNVACTRCHGSKPDIFEDIQARLYCSHCNSSGLEINAHKEAIAARLEPLTWIRDRMPEVGDVIELRYAVPRTDRSLGSTTVRGEVTRFQQNSHGDMRFVVQAGGGEMICYADMVDGWRYRVHSTDAQATAGHRADPRPAAPRDAGQLP